MANDRLITPSMITGAEVSDLLTHYWPGMSRTRANADASADVIAGVDEFVLPSTFTIAGADQYIASIPQPRTVPQRAVQGLIGSRPHLSIPLGPKGLGISSQRLTTKVEEPLNAILEDRKVGFQWERACGLLLFEGWCAGITVTDPSDWQTHDSQWDDSESKALRKQGDDSDDPEKATAYYEQAKKAGQSATRKHGQQLEIHRARNIPIRHRAIGIRNAAPIFGPDLSVEGLIVSQEFSTSWLRRHYAFGDVGVATPTGGNAQGGASSTGISTTGMGTLTLIEAWLYDEDGLPYVSYCVKGSKGPMATKWKDSDDLATINLKDRFGLDRLPVHWEFGLGNPAELNPDLRAMGFLEPFIQGWRSVRAKMTANNVAILFGSYPILIEEPLTPSGPIGSMDDDEPEAPDIMPMKIVQGRAGVKLSQLKIEAVGAEAYKQIDLELGAIAEESPGRSNKDQSGFSQSMAAAFEEQAMTTVHEGLGRLYEAHGSFTLEAGKRLPEMGKKKSGTKYAPIMVFKSTDVPVNDGDSHNEPMELDPDLIDETFTTKARYTKSMSIPEEQQSMEAVARNLKTRRQHLEDTGDDTPEETELELMLEQLRGTPAYQAYAMKLMAQIQGSEELAEITKSQSEGLANDSGVPTGYAQGTPPALPPGMQQPMLPGAPGVPQDGSVTGMGGSSYGQASLAATVGGAGMTGPIGNAQAAGGLVPPNLPTPAGIGAGM